MHDVIIFFDINLSNNNGKRGKNKTKMTRKNFGTFKEIFFEKANEKPKKSDIPIIFKQSISNPSIFKIFLILIYRII